MCDLGHHDLEPLAEDEYVLDTPRVRGLVARVAELRAASSGARETCEAVRPLFVDLLADRDWLPDAFQHDAPESGLKSGMGGGIGQWLLYRAADRSLSLFSLVVPPGARTPIHDHLAWGLVGLYRGSQDEELYRAGDGTIECVRRRPLEPGDHYALLPPENDVHCVRTTSAETSVSIHLLANDTGCVLRHTYDEQTGEQSPFRSGWVNADCGA
jgi:3-mercaptopropionate dioxygenase